MKKLLLPSFFLLAMNVFAQQKFQLAPPLVKYQSAFFSGSTELAATFNQPGTEIRYTLNGSEPAESSLLYRKSISIKHEGAVKLKSFGNDFLPSETVEIHFIKEGKQVQQIDFSAPNESYAKAPKNILYDNIGGFTNFRGGTWIGYNKDSAVITITLEKNEKIKSVLLDMLADESSWIFLPEQINMYYLDRKSNTFKELASEKFAHDSPGPMKCVNHKIVPDKKIKTSQLRIVFTVLKKIPDWHPGKGSTGWFFIDEIKVY